MGGLLRCSVLLLLVVAVAVRRLLLRMVVRVVRVAVVVLTGRRRVRVGLVRRGRGLPVVPVRRRGMVGVVVVLAVPV